MSPGDPRLASPEYSTPDRLLFLDGTLQSVASSEIVYHEAMVHPGMFAHPNPETVVIVGGGEGATLREVLKHKTVKSVTMIEIDQEMVKVAQQYLPDFSNCSDFLDRAANCFEDPLVDIRYEDATKWFMDRYGPNPTKDPLAAPIDVILLDALDPEEENEASEHLYTDSDFYNAVLKGLSPDGVLAIQVGTAATIDDPRADVGIYRNRERLFNLLEAHDDVGAMLIYEEGKVAWTTYHLYAHR
jgi:spermidine synthase